LDVLGSVHVVRIPISGIKLPDLDQKEKRLQKIEISDSLRYV